MDNKDELFVKFYELEVDFDIAKEAKAEIGQLTKRIAQLKNQDYSSDEQLNTRDRNIKFTTGLIAQKEVQVEEYNAKLIKFISNLDPSIPSFSRTTEIVRVNREDHLLEAQGIINKIKRRINLL